MVECPKGINITHLMYALKQRAIEEHFYPKRFPIPVMAHEFSSMVRKKGRITESWLVVRVFLRSSFWRLMGMSGLGFRLFRAGRMNIKQDKITARRDMVTLLDSVAATRKELAI
jgi:heterodisulfide reductase subunit C/quinone-modifying oxidoreductase subunit QmoC